MLCTDWNHDMKSCSQKARTKPCNMSRCFGKHHSFLHGSRAAPLRDTEPTRASPLAPETKDDLLLKLLQQNRELRKQLEEAQAGTLHPPVPVIKAKPSLTVDADPVINAASPATQFCRKVAAKDPSAAQDSAPVISKNQTPDDTREKENENLDEDKEEIPENAEENAKGGTPSTSTSIKGQEEDIPLTNANTTCVPEKNLQVTNNDSPLTD